MNLDRAAARQCQFWRWPEGAREHHLSERRHILEDLMRGAAGAIRLSEKLDGDGDQLL
jgi:ATP-dependent DNA ligase